MSKESHGFNPDVAVAIGVNSAIIFGHLIFLHKCLLGKKDDWDGTRFWIKKTATAFAKTYPYFTSKEIRGALDRMEKAGLIVSQTGVDVNRFDRTKGYSIEAAGFDLMETNKDERQVNPFDKRANAETQKGKSDVDKRANQMLTKGQMNNSYIPYTDLSEKEETANADGVVLKKEKPFIKPKKPVLKFDLSDKYQYFTDPEKIAQIWERWMKYRSDTGHAFKSEDSVVTCLRKLYHYSKGEVKTANEIVETSIGNGWQGLFEPKAPITEKPKNQPPPIIYTSPAPRQKTPDYVP